MTKREVRLLRPDLLRVDLDGPEGRGTVLFTKKRIRVYDPRDKSVKIFPKPADTTFLGEKTRRHFLSGNWVSEAYQQQVYWMYAGLPVRDLSRRFDLRLFKEDAWYIYLDLVPPESARYQYTRMRVVLRKTSFRVRQIWFEEPNGNAVTLDFEKVETNPKMTPESMREGLPKDWKRVRFPKVRETPEPRTKE